MRYKSEVVTEDSYILTLASYIFLDTNETG